MGPKANFQPVRKSGIAVIGVKLFKAILEGVEARAQAVGGVASRDMRPLAKADIVEQSDGKSDGPSFSSSPH